MRRVAVVATLLVGLAQTAHAADLPDFGALRGPVGYQSNVVNWQGVYAGGQVGYGSADINFAGSNTALIGQALGPNNILFDTVSSVGHANGKVNVHQTTYGGFLGYNSQWDDVVVGLEGNYMHGNFNGASTVAPFPLTYVTPFADGLYHTVGLNSSRSVSITDMGTVRARAGYVIDNFLPYVFGGAAFGRANISSNVTITDRAGTTFANSSSGPLVTYSATDAIGGKMLYGYTAGLGTDFMLYGNLFGRVEWEYVRFVNAGGDININTVRGGLGYKF